MLIGLVSCYREGQLAADAVRTLRDVCNVVVVAEGPIGEPKTGGRETDWRQYRNVPSVIVHRDKWATDAAKRTWLLQKTRRYPAPVWGVILDGDELLLHGEQIPSLIEYREAQADNEEAVAFNVPLRLVEADSSIGFLTARVLRLDLIDAWLISSYHIRMRNGVEVSLPNAYPLKCGEPDRRELEPTTGLQIRRPLSGEPHILHRSPLRAPDRDAVRQSSAEGSEFERMVREAALTEVAGERIQDDRPAIWLPQ